MTIEKCINYKGIDKFFIGSVVTVRTQEEYYTGRIAFIGEDCFDLDISEQYNAHVMRLYLSDVKFMCRGNE